MESEWIKKILYNLKLFWFCCYIVGVLISCWWRERLHRDLVDESWNFHMGIVFGHIFCSVALGDDMMMMLWDPMFMLSICIFNLIFKVE